MRFLFSRHVRLEVESLGEVEPGRKVYVSTSVSQGSEVVSVCRDRDGSWQFFSEEDKSGPEGPVLIHFEHVPGQPDLAAAVPGLRKGNWALRDSDDGSWAVVRGD
ncbi:hypothetical protein [Kitasatospora sp. A2-31]|uniref:hypothetical protein n=1 Tax=Kitasatospora sp. A2-31 TaxID=2916414 RepID=UPI001EEC3B08|nr:hypothetical protein [Kitasatospora sp. A2-31]MCG6495788.1 hypothetical protein [Kitasatospora sp. A2-31]